MCICLVSFAGLGLEGASPGLERAGLGLGTAVLDYKTAKKSLPFTIH